MGNILHPKQTKVLSKKTAVWPAVLADVQLRLREVFGMELVELRSAGQGDPTLRVRALQGNVMQRSIGFLYEIRFSSS